MWNQLRGTFSIAIGDSKKIELPMRYFISLIGDSIRPFNNLIFEIFYQPMFLDLILIFSKKLESNVNYGKVSFLCGYIS